MQDEILAKALVSDNTPVPRYTIRDANGVIIAQNATIELVNPIAQEGTPINTATLLSQETANKFKSSIPSTVNEAIALLSQGQGQTFEGLIRTSDWSSGLATAQISIDTGSRSSDCLVYVMPVVTETNAEAWAAARVKCYDNRGVRLYFKASQTPTRTLYFSGVVFEL